MWGTHDLPLFIATSIAMTLVPGPSTMYIVGRSVSQGRRAGVLSVLGIGTGSLCHTIAVAFGLAVLVAASRVAFTAIKFAGAAYLVYLGVQTIRKRSALAAKAVEIESSSRRVYGEGLVTQVLNPKASLFFLAMLPQFVAPSAAHSPAPFLALGALSIAMDVSWFLFVANGSALATTWLRRSEQAQGILKWASGLLFIGLGLGMLKLTARTA
jgi:threonine/homoserine/homoserine lactone efflux protein